MVFKMAEMTTWEWFSRAWASFIFWAGIPGMFATLGASTMLAAISGPAMIWIMPWFMFGEVKAKDFKTGSFAANHAVKIAEIDIAEMVKFVFNMVITILDTAETVGGLKIDEDSIETWRANLNDEQSWLSVTWDLYWWDYLQKANFKIISNRPDIVANEGGDYKMADLLLDIAVIVGAVLLIIFFSKKGSQMATKIGGIFKKQKAKRRVKASKSRELRTLTKLDELKLQLRVLSSAIKRQNELIRSTQDKDIVPDLDQIIEQTRQGLRL